MKYLLTYIYDGIHECKKVSGQGSVDMNANTDKITPKLIKDAIEWVRNEFRKNGTGINNIAPMGWFKYDEEDAE